MTDAPNTALERVKELVAEVLPNNTSLTNFTDFRCSHDDLVQLFEAAHKQAYQEGWNDREEDLLAGVARISPPPSIQGEGDGKGSASADLSPASRSQEQHSAGEVECHGLDTPERVCFYEQDFYVLSNFSSFAVRSGGTLFPTSEHLYHHEKFSDGPPWGRTAERAAVALMILEAPSAHEAFRIAQEHKHLRRSDWDEVKVDIMRDILLAKALQHEYVRRKLLATGDRELVENSWRDDYWGWGPNRDGQNMLGKLWMEVRAELRGLEGSAPADGALGRQDRSVHAEPSSSHPTPDAGPSLERVSDPHKLAASLQGQGSGE